MKKSLAEYENSNPISQTLRTLSMGVNNGYFKLTDWGMELYKSLIKQQSKGEL